LASLFVVLAAHAPSTTHRKQSPSPELTTANGPDCAGLGGKVAGYTHLLARHGSVGGRRITCRVAAAEHGGDN
jgi:hypothetical protein